MPTKPCLAARRPPSRLLAWALWAFLSLSLLWPTASTASALSSLRFTHLGIEEGLPSPYVLSSLQDSQGMIWLGTTNGLARYDGRRVKTFLHKPQAPDSPSHSVIQALLEDPLRQVIWMGGFGGLDRLDLRTERIQRLSAPTELTHRARRVVGLAPATEGRLWVAFSGGLYLYDPVQGSFTLGPHSGNAEGRSNPYFITAMCADGASGVWVARNDHISHIKAGPKAYSQGLSFKTGDGLGGMQLRSGERFVNRLALDAQGRVWVGLGAGLQTWRVKDGRAEPDPLASQLNLPRQMVHALLLDQDGAMWIGIGELAVLHRWREDSERLETFEHLPGVAASLSSQTLASLMQDRSGVLWVGSTESGIDLVDLRRQGFSSYLSIPGDPQSLSSPVVMAILLDGTEHAWIGSYGGGLNRLHLPSGKVQQIPSKDMPISHAKALLAGPDGQIWVGGDRGLVLYKPQPGQPAKVVLSDSQTSISAIVPDQERPGGIWASSASGLYRIDAQLHIHRYQAQPKQPGALIHPIIDSLMWDRQGRLWIGSKEGLQWWDAATDSFSAPVAVEGADADLPSPAIHGMRQDSQGRIWLATDQGLYELINRRPKERGEVKTWSMKSWRGIPGMPVGGFEAIQDALNGELWLASERGLTRVRPAERQARFFGGHGQFDRGFNFAAANRGPDGALYFGGPGLLRFWPEKLKDNPAAPKVILSDLLILNRSLLEEAQTEASTSSKENKPSGSHASLADLGINGPLHLTKSIRLSPNENMVSFELAALHFDRVKLNRYAWQLEGFDRDWIYGQGSLGLATYTNLDPGRYRLRAKAANSDGVWSEAQDILVIDVLPPFWRTWWWRTGLLLLLGLTLAGAYRLRVAALQSAKHLLEQEVASRTHQLADEKRIAFAQREVAEKARRDIALLSEIGRQITASLDLAAIQQTLYKHVQELVDASVFGVGLLDRRARTLNFDFVMQRGQAFKPYCRSLDDTHQPAVRCALQARELCIAAFSHDNRELSTSPGRSGRVQLLDGQEPEAARSGIYIPMLLKGEVIGVISLLSEKPGAFGPTELDILRTLGAYAAVAIDNAEAYKQLQLTQSKLVEQEKLAALGSLVAGVAHELNTPLGNSLLLASTLRDVSSEFLRRTEEGALRRKELEQFCQSNAESALLLVNSLQQATHLISGFKQLAVDQTSEQRRSFDLRTLCDEITLTLGNRLRQGDHELRLVLGAGLQMDSYPGPLGQVLSNLIINALVHGLEGRRQGLMTLRAQKMDDALLRIEFSDNGCGIKAEHLGRVFEPFFTTKLGQGGSGLGLHISYNIVTGMLGGSIAVSSEPGAGTCFTLTIPFVAT
ncbi:two-component regulator propeller domain-containing protein [Roseateles sp.]|uniref:two-component regulator propeller domain-containing protein n=1 Tax=Roseateles sp. TaxID=1971397 RepID=UPI003BA6E96B